MEEDGYTTSAPNARHEPQIQFWNELRVVLRKRHVPSNYYRELTN